MLLTLSTAAACRAKFGELNDGSTRAIAYLLDSAGREVGQARFTQAPGASALDYSITIQRGATTGQHGVHLHATGSCDPTTKFESAGDHFNPGGRKHGLSSPDGPHAGDLEALTVDITGASKFTSRTPRMTLTPGPSSLLDADGSAIVLHALPDDQRTDPSGSSGARIACGVVTKV